jgi:enoyl-CoA hydratase
MTSTDPVLSAVDGGVATVTLNRPEARNALSSEVLRLLPAVMASLDADPAVSAIIVTGSDPAFCAGLDLKELGSSGANLGSGTAGEVRRGPWGELATPIIGAVNGPAITGGLEVALNCDLLIASERARFADTHARVGVMPGWGLSVLLAEAVGVRRAREMSFSGNFVDAATALTWGLVNRVVPHDELLPTCVALARDIAGNDQRGVQRMKATYRAVTEVTAGEGWQVEARMGREWAGTGIDPGAVEARRRAIVDRGRSQL